MAEGGDDRHSGEDLVKQDLITREELAEAHEYEAQSGTPWYKQLLQMRKVTFEAVEDVLRYEFHPKAVRAEHESLGSTLLEMELIAQKQLEEALAEQKRNGRLLGNILLERGIVSPDGIARALAKQHGLEYADLFKTPSDREALEAVPESVARKYEMIPISLYGDRLAVLITSPQTRPKLSHAAILLGKRIHPLLSAADDVQAVIKERYKAVRDPAAAPSKPPRNKQSAKPKPQPEPEASETPAPTQGEIRDVAEKKKTVELKHEPDSARFEEIARAAQGASVMRMVSTIIEGAVNSGATDVHLDPQDPEMRVRYRIDGILHDIMSIPDNLEPAVVSRIKIMADLDITNTRHPQDGHISMEINNAEYDVRVATLPTFLGERVVLRLLDQTSVLSGIRDLGMESDDEKLYRRLIDQPYGMILVTGPTGSGKTTTLYSSLNQKNVMTDSIVTLEDPVEYQISGINQVQVDPDIGNTFANTLRAALRQDIDVLLVGEIRDQETARIAVRAAMTGHLVFSTLHTNDAPEAIAALRNMQVPSYLLASALSAILGQRLVRTICPDCRAEFKPTASLLKSVGLPVSVKKLYRGAGCDHCYRTGNRGRTGIFEILEITPEIRQLIGEDAAAEKIVKAAKLKTMAMRCREKVKKGIVAPEEFLRVIRT